MLQCLGASREKTKDWWNVGLSSRVRRWQHPEGSCPFKRHEGKFLRNVFGLDSPERVRPDQMHIYAYGYGKDFAASSVVLASRLGLFPGRSMQSRMDTAFDAFKQWCVYKKKSTSLSGFTPKAFKMGQYPI